MSFPTKDERDILSSLEFEPLEDGAFVQETVNAVYTSLMEVSDTELEELRVPENAIASGMRDYETFLYAVSRTASEAMGFHFYQSWREDEEARLWYQANPCPVGEDAPSVGDFMDDFFNREMIQFEEEE